MMRILLGLGISAIGLLITIYSEWMYQTFGPLNFGERFLISSEGGSRLIYKLIGIMVTFVGFLIITNLHEAFLLWILGPLIPGLK